jgi:hypothetical protein
MSFYLRVPGKMSNEQARSLAMFYFFLSVEHRINDTELAAFEQIGSLHEGFDEAKGTIVGECEKLLLERSGGKSRFEVVEEQLTDYAASSSNETDKRSVLWMLVGISGKEDASFDIRQELITLFANKSGIDVSILDEMRDTVQTMLSLEYHKTWVQALPHGEAEPMMTEIEKNSADMRESISNLITIG